MKKATKDQAAVLRAARATLGKTNAELGAELGKSEKTILSWLAPKGSAMRRTMPKASVMLLERVLKEHREKSK